MARFSSRFRMTAFAALSAFGTTVPGVIERMGSALRVAGRSRTHKNGPFNGQVAPYADTLRGTRMRHYTVAMAKRAATKRRNQTRHRRSCRG